jgi:hypothetical protein
MESSTPATDYVDAFSRNPQVGRSILGMPRMPRMARRIRFIMSSVISKFVDRSWQLVGDVERDAYLARFGYAPARTAWVLLGRR